MNCYRVQTVTYGLPDTVPDSYLHVVANRELTRLHMWAPVGQAKPTNKSHYTRFIRTYNPGVVEYQE